MSLPPELLKKVKLLEVSTRRLVNNLFAGEYHTAFKGQGITFSEFREYVPGDDVRSIAWSLTAKTGRPFIKKFDEEREMTLLLAVDVSGSQDYGSKGYLKGEAVTHLAALLAFSAERNRDPVGLLLFSDQVEHYVPPRKGRGQVHRILRDLYYYKPHSRQTDIARAGEFLRGVLKKRANIFLFSDFFSNNYEASLKVLSKKHEVVAVVVSDPTENQLPPIGLVDFEDPETGEIWTADTSSPIFRRDFQNSVKQMIDRRDQELVRAQIERINIFSDKDIVQPLVGFFKRRLRR